MGLVEYSESEGSDSGHGTQRAPAPEKPSASSSKQTFRKVVDRSNPHKVRVNLPDISRTEGDRHEVDGGERSPKRVKTGGGAFSGFNSFLPAPKRAPLKSDTGSQTGQGQRRGLGSGVNLKTGPSPGFSREAQSEALDMDAKWDSQMASSDVGSQEQVQETNGHSKHDAIAGAEVPTQPTPQRGTPMMFKPLSVARRPQKKRAGVSADPVSNVGNPANAAKPAKRAPNISLFSLSSDSTDIRPSTSSAEEYKPLIYSPAQVKRKSPSPESLTNIDIEEDVALKPSATFKDTSTPSSVPQSLDSIASDLNLSASAKRQLFGRQRGSNHTNASAINIVNFNTDEEYAANEALRAAGEQVQHNPVRAIAPGKHSLQQLVNAASNQKDALEEHFASGKRNKKEAGSRYGW